MLTTLIHRAAVASAFALVAAHSLPTPATAQSTITAPVLAEVTAFKQAVAAGASADEVVAQFYRDTGYQPIWTGADDDDRDRRAALLHAVSSASIHGLPAGRYQPDALEAQMAAARSERDRGRLEVDLTIAFLRYAQDIQTGILTPGKIDSDIKRDVPVRDRREILDTFLASSPTTFFRTLMPRAPEYARLMKEKLRLEGLIEQGGWGPTIGSEKLARGDSGDAVIALRNRLIAMGYLESNARTEFDANMERAIYGFQFDHGLEADGEAGATTIAEINKSAKDRLGQILVAMERERWMNIPRGDRHVWVNLTDFSAAIIDDDKVTFRTRSVIGKDQSGRRSPEFSDEMEHMVINPQWFVPRSIVTKEYLPQLQRNPYAVSHLRVTDSRGRVVNRGSVNFNAYSARSFPFAMSQPSGPRNALGRVKFMFPNKHNIYLHDTPAKALFEREVRAFSHGCIRLNDPFDFAYTVLARQTEDPIKFFHTRLESGREARVDLDQTIPVHIVYRTVFTDARGKAHYRRDVYGRDAAILRALEGQGVVVGATNS